MKNILFAVFFGLLLVSCSGDDDGENMTDDEASVNECKAVTSLNVSVLLLQKLRINFNPNGFASSYNVEYGESGFANGQGIFVEDVETFRPIDTDFKGDTAYEFYVIKVCQDGSLANSVRESFTTPTCPIPTNFISSNISATSASIQWSDPELVNNYEVEYGRSGFELGSGIVQNVQDNITFLSNLEAGSSYDIYVRTNCGGEFGEYSSKFTFSTEFNCNKPFNLQWTTISSSYIDLFWQSNGESAWQIEYGLVGFQIGTGSIEITSTKPYRINGLQNNTAYQFYIRAICTQGGYSGRESIIVSTLEP